MTQLFSNLFYISPVLFTLMFATLALSNWSTYWIAAVIASLVEFFIIGSLLKMITVKTKTASLRPKYHEEEKLTYERNGMPSAHVSNAVFSIIIVCYFLMSCSKSIAKNVIILLISIAIVCGVAWQRIYTLMHTKKQVAVGSMVGIVEAFLFLFIFKLCEKKTIC